MEATIRSAEWRFQGIHECTSWQGRQCRLMSPLCLSLTKGTIQLLSSFFCPNYYSKWSYTAVPSFLGFSSRREASCLLHHCCLVAQLATPWTVAHHAPLFTGFPRQEHWSGLPSFSRGSSWPRDWTHNSWTGRQILYHWATRGAHCIISSYQRDYNSLQNTSVLKHLPFLESK